MEPLFTVIGDLSGVHIKAWNRGVQFEESGLIQLQNVARLPFVKPYVASMPDMHWGNGATVGSVIPAIGAIMPAAVGVDIGCGMMAVRTNLTPDDVAEGKRKEIYDAIYKAVPTGRTNDGAAGDRGAWHNVPDYVRDVWLQQIVADPAYNIFADHPDALGRRAENQLGTLGTGNHFIEVCTDEGQGIWIVLHSGSRGFGNRLATYFTNIAKEQCKDLELPDPELAHLTEGTQEFDDYVKLLMLAQKYAWKNRVLMMWRVLNVLNTESIEPEALHDFPPIVHIHHNYMAKEVHFGQEVILTRKGAVRAGAGEYVIIPGSMGARTYIGRGLGSEHSFESCSHGAGRRMSRGQAKKTISVEQHAQATEGVECHKGAEVIDESPSAYKDIERVMAAQSDLVEPVVALKQIICVKGIGDSSRGRRRRG